MPAITFESHITYLKVFAISIAMLCCNHCSFCQQKSRVISFNYGGLGDNINSTLIGNLYFSPATNIQKDTLLPLKGVLIISYDKTNKEYKKTFTDDKGYFSMEFRNAVYSLTFVKPGYQSLTLTNYESIGDQVSDAEIVSFHIPLTSETMWMVNKAYLQRFKHNIHLINTSRGKIIRHLDLLQCIYSKIEFRHFP